MTGHSRKTLPRRFWSKVNKTDTCWLWTASAPTGYGQISIDGRQNRAHRVAYEMEYGEIPDGMCVLHTCDTPLCVRPDHLFLGTPADNARDMIKKGRKWDNSGSNNPNAKLTEKMVKEIINAPKEWGVQRKLAKKFGVSESTISMIRNPDKWPRWNNIAKD